MKENLSAFQLMILVLSFYVIGALAVDVLFDLSDEMSQLLHYIDLVVCFFFFLDFAIRFRAAPSKWRFMRWGWIDLLASIPAGLLFAGRLVRVVQVIRVLRAIKSLHMIWRILFRNRAEGLFASVATATLLLVAFGSMTILLVESPNPESSIDTAEEALWWAFVTVTTVGYGDYYPMTTLGRVVAVALMVAGVGLFGSFAAYISSLFIGDQEDENARQHKASRELTRQLYHEVVSLRKELDALRAELPVSHGASPPRATPVSEVPPRDPPDNTSDES
ncbi:ion transporter [Halomonas halocynthiae]|uniref:ion transporter n=1 Tax=Halomonas halocynthiae TaxID=176290 RepID=UPI00042278E6|nr:ion transporter [Halomonas halocynthiae]